MVVGVGEAMFAGDWGMVSLEVWGITWYMV